MPAECDKFGLIDIDYLREFKKDYEILCGVYFLFLGDELIYIGGSTNCFMRFSEHRRLGKEFDSYFIIETRRSDLRKIESKYIAYYNPSLNKRW